MQEIERLNSLTGRNALIVGAGRGIGKEIANYFAQAGDNLVLTARSASELSLTRKHIEATTNVRVSTIPCDATDQDTMQDIFSSLEELDILVYVAGTSAQVPAQEYTKKQYEQIYGLNCHGLFSCCAMAYPLLEKSKTGGRVIAISSHLGVVGLPLRTLYCSSKAAVIHYCRTLAAEWAPAGITVNCIAPGYTSTELSQKVLKEPAFRDDVIRKTPLGIIGEVGDIAGAALFIASSASHYMTGQTIVIDGGWSCV